MGKGGDDLGILFIARGGSSSPGLCTSHTDAAGVPCSGRKRPGRRVSLKDAERSRTCESHFECMCTSVHNISQVETGDFFLRLARLFGDMVLETKYQDRLGPSLKPQWTNRRGVSEICLGWLSRAKSSLLCLQSLPEVHVLLLKLPPQ